MPFLKFADASFTMQEIHNSDTIILDSALLDRFTKFARKLNAVAPKAKDFTYFSCVMLHADTAALINQDTGEPILGKNGKPVTAEWEINPKTGSWKWKCSDLNIKPAKNNNGDIFPESELKKAYRLWIEKPLCQDHQSNTVDGMRGLILDTYWDDKRKRVIGLCALDKKNYPDLARKVEGGYATNVSMGTAVGKSICFECGNVAKVEAEYCKCVRSRSTYGEINIDLSPIELSLVVTGADPRAKLRHIIASLDIYTQQKQERIAELQRAGCVTPGELNSLRTEIDMLRRQLNEISKIRAQAALDPSQGANIRVLLETISSTSASAEVKDLANKQLLELLGGQTTPKELAKMEAPAAEDGNGNEGSMAEDVEKNPEGGQKASDVEPPYGLAGNKAMTGGKGRSCTEDPESSGPPPWSLDGRETRLASGSLEDQITTVLKRLDDMRGSLQVIQAAANRTPQKEEKDMSDLKERARARRVAFEKNAYHQGGGGVNDPQTYPKDPMAEKVRDTQDKQMVGEGMEPGNDGLAGDDLALKQKLSRAQLEERRLRRHALLSKGAEVVKVKAPDGTDVALTKGADGKWVLAPAQQAEDETGLESVAYFQGGGGVNEPQVYPKDPMAEKVRNTQDKQMVGEGMEPGNDGLAGDDLALKKKLLRAEFKFSRLVNGEPDRKKAHWDVYAGDKLVLTATGEQIYGDDLLAREDYWAHLSSTDYGKRIMSEIRNEGLNKVAYMLTGKVVTAQEPMPPMPPMPMSAAPVTTEEPPKEEEKPGAEATKGRVDEALAEVEKKLGDLKEILKEESKSEEGGKEELPPIEVGGEGEAAKATALDVHAALDDSGDELAILSEVLSKRIEAGMSSGTEMDELMKLAEESLEASSEFCREAGLIIEAKKKGLPEGLKKAIEEKEKEKGKKGKKEDKEDKKEKGKKEDKEDKEEKGKKGKKDEEDEDGKEEKGKKGKKDEEDEDDKGKKSEAELVLEKMLKVRAAKRRELVRQAIGEGEQELEEKEHEVHEEMEEGLEGLEGMIEELEDIDMKELKGDEAQYADEGSEDPLVNELLAELEGEGLTPEGGAFEEEAASVSEDGMETLASRRAWREKVAAEVGSKYQMKLDPATDMDTDMVPQAHPQRGTTLGGLDTKPSDEGAHVEGIDEIKAKIMKQVESLPAVREAVAKVGDLLKSGKLATTDLSNDAKLRALAVDPEAAKYWKQFFGEGDPASKQFGQDLTKEFTQKKAAVEAESYKLKLRRAVDLSLDMQEKGLISQGRDTMNRQVDDIMKFDEPAFEAFKRALSRTSNIAKTAGRSEPALQVGLKEDVEVVNISNQLDRLWLPKRK
jgi:hypothetical protein